MELLSPVDLNGSKSILFEALYIDDRFVIFNFQWEYIDEIFELCEKYQDEYYVKMAIAWLISMCYIKYQR